MEQKAKIGKIVLIISVILIILVEVAGFVFISGEVQINRLILLVAIIALAYSVLQGKSWARFTLGGLLIIVAIMSFGSLAVATRDKDMMKYFETTPYLFEHTLVVLAIYGISGGFILISTYITALITLQKPKVD